MKARGFSETLVPLFQIIHHPWT